MWPFIVEFCDDVWLYSRLDLSWRWCLQAYLLFNDSPDSSGFSESRECSPDAGVHFVAECLDQNKACVLQTFIVLNAIVIDISHFRAIYFAVRFIFWKFISTWVIHQRSLKAINLSKQCNFFDATFFIIVCIIKCIALVVLIIQHLNSDWIIFGG